MIEIRHCRVLEELEACVNLQVEVWGYSDGDVIPRRLFIVAQEIGGQVVGAFDPERDPHPGGETTARQLVGFAMALPAIRSTPSGPRPYLHSHMLAVKEAYRNRGIGMQLKLAQREDALNRGIQLMEWTFDPLEIKNAYLNIHKLGVIVRRYTPDFYGVSSSRLQCGLPTDRLHAEWWLNSPRVVRALFGQGQSNPLTQVHQEILVPAEIAQWKTSPKQSAQARMLQLANRERFEQAFRDGLVVVGLVRDSSGSGFFQLGEWDQPAGW